MSAALSFDEMATLAATIVAKAKADEAFHKRFMDKAAGDTDAFAAYLASAEVGLPKDVADHVAPLGKDDLYRYVGKYICGYLW